MDNKPKTCLTCANWRENPEQCYNCTRNSSTQDCWRSIGSPGFVRDAGKPTSPRLPCSNEDLIKSIIGQAAGVPMSELNWGGGYAYDRIERALKECGVLDELMRRLGVEKL